MPKPALVFLTLLVSCSPAMTWLRHDAKPSSYQRTIVDHSAPKTKLEDVAPDQARAVVDATYRVRPDRRFVNAAADIVEINGGHAIGSVDIDFSANGWDVRAGDEHFLTLPELITFHDALAVLSKWASEQRASERTPLSKPDLAAIDADIARFYPRFLFSALRRLDAHRPPDAAASARAAHAAALLAAQTGYEAFDLNDTLLARAVALLATAKSLDPSCCAESEALLAYTLGYTGEAEAAAANLPPGFARWFVTGANQGAGGDAAADWIALMLRLRNEPIFPSREDQKQFSGTIDTEAAPLLLEDDRFGDNWPIGAVMQRLVLDSLDGKHSFAFDSGSAWQKTMRGAEPQSALQQYEEKVRPFAKAQASQLLGEPAILSFYDSIWYAALQQQLTVPFDHFGDAPGTTRFVASLHPQSMTGQHVVAWMSNLVDAYYGRLQRDRIAPAIEATSLVGGWRQNILLKRMADTIGWNGPELHEAATRLFITLDSRPGEMLVAAKLADLPIADLARRDLYWKTALDRTPGRFAEERSDYDYSIGDHDALRRLAADRSASIEDRITALYWMSQIADEDYHADFEQVFIDAGYSTNRIEVYWDYLNRRKQPELKERFARAILKHRTDLSPITEAYITAVLGNALEAEGKYNEAWKWVEPKIPVYSGNILSTATSLLQRLGRNDEAIALGNEMIERYPDASTRSDFAAVLWRMRRYDDAAALFDPARHANALGTARTELPERFAQSFSDAQVEDALAAYEAMIKAHVPPALLNRMSNGFYDAKRWPMAFAIMERYLKVPTTGWDRGEQEQTYGFAYRVLKEWKGPDAALSWFSAQFPNSGDQNVLVSLASEDQLQLLTDFVTAHPPHVKDTASASIVALAFSLQRIPLNDPRWQIVRDMLRPAAGADDKTLFLCVRSLMHEVQPSQVSAIAAGRDRFEASYFNAVRAVADGDFDAALPQFVYGAEGPAGWPPTTLAMTRLYRWRAKLKPWREIAAQHLV